MALNGVSRRRTRQRIVGAFLTAVGVVGLLAGNAVAADGLTAELAASDLEAPASPPPPRSVYVGATLTSNSPGWGPLLKRSEASGALVLMVLPWSPAAASGLTPGDVVVAVDAERVQDDQRFLALLRESQVVRHTLTVIRASGQVVALDLRTDVTPPRSLNEDVNQLVSAQPTPSNRFVFARLLTDPRAAVAVLDDLLREFPDMADALAARAELMLQLGPQDKAEELMRQAAPYLERALELGPDALSVQLASARMYTRVGDLPLAERHAAAAVAIDTDSASAHLLLGRSKLLARRPSEAVPDLLSSIRLDPFVEAGYESLSQAYRLLGATESAKATDAALQALRVGLGAAPIGRAGGNPVGTALMVAAAIVIGVGSSVFRRPRSPIPEREDRGAGPSVLATLEVMAVAAAFSTIVPPLGRSLALSPGGSLGKEILDHTVPGMVLLVVCVLAILAQLENPDGVRHRTLVLGVASASAVWITGTHMALMGEAIRGRVAIETALWHWLVGPILFVLAARLQWVWVPWKVRLMHHENGGRRSASSPHSNGT